MARASVSLGFDTRNNYGREITKLRVLGPRLEEAMRRGTEYGTAIIANATIYQVMTRTSMSVQIAEAITLRNTRRYSSKHYRGTVRFMKPPKDGWPITPRTKKALAFNWRGQNVVFAKVQHPGSRPYKLIRRGAEDNVDRIWGAYAREVGEVIR